MIWTSSNTTIASVSNGVVKGLKPGSATISVVSADGGVSTPVTCSVVVTKKPDPPKPSKPDNNTSNNPGVFSFYNVTINSSIVSMRRYVSSSTDTNGVYGRLIMVGY